MIQFLKNKVSTSKAITKSDAIRITEVSRTDAVDLFAQGLAVEDVVVLAQAQVLGPGA